MSQIGNIDIKPAELRSLASNIGRQRDALTSQFEQMRARMTSLEREGWDSESGRELRQKFDRLFADYQRKYPPAMNNYMSFLNQTAENYESEERSRRSDVDTMRDSFN